MNARQRLCSAIPVISAAILIVQSSAQGGVIVGYDAAQAASHNTYDRFLTPFPAAPAFNNSPNFVLNSFSGGPAGIGNNLSGIGWNAANSGFAIAMVSPQNFVCNWHVLQGGFFDPNGVNGLNQVQFLNRAGQVKTYTISTNPNLAPFRPTTTFNIGQGPQTLPSDVYFGTLSSPIPAADMIDFYPVTNGSPNAFLNLPFFATGQNPAYTNPSTGTSSPHFGKNNVDAIDVLSFDGAIPVNEATQATIYDFNAALPGELHLISGDSGGPSFLRTNGQLGVLGTHYGLDPQTNTSADTFLPFYIDQINAHMTAQGLGYQLTVVGVPEPSTLLLVGLATALGARRLRSRRRAKSAA